MKERLHLPLFLLIIRPWSKKENELGGTFMQGMAQKKKDGKVLDFIERGMVGFGTASGHEIFCYGNKTS